MCGAVFGLYCGYNVGNGGGCHASHSCLPQHAWHSGGLLDGTAAHMANHSSRAEAFSKGPGSNLKRGCLHRGQRPSGQQRPVSCWPLRGRHISSKGCNPPTHTHTHTPPSAASMYSTQCSSRPANGPGTMTLRAA